MEVWRRGCEALSPLKEGSSCASPATPTPTLEGNVVCLQQQPSLLTCRRAQMFQIRAAWQGAQWRDSFVCRTLDKSDKAPNTPRRRTDETRRYSLAQEASYL